MVDFAALALASLLSREELLFSPVPKQVGPGGCGPAVLEALLGPERLAALLPGVPAEGLSLGELEAILAGASVPSRGRRLDLSEVEQTLSLGFAPLILHYDRPEPHWALLLGKAGADYALGDPGRGLELLDVSQLSGRHSGAALILDPRSLDPARLALIEEGRAEAHRRRALLLALAPTPAAAASTTARSSSPEPCSGRARPSLGLRLGAAILDEGSPFEGLGSLRLAEAASGLSIEAGCFLSLPAGESWPLPFLLAEFQRSLSRGFYRFGLGFGTGEAFAGALPTSKPGAPPSFSVSADLALLRDPLLLGIGGALVFETGIGGGGRTLRGPPEILLRLSLVEALGGDLGLRFDTGVRVEPGRGGPRLFFGLGFALGAPRLGLSLLYLEEEGRRGLRGSFDYLLVDG